MKFITVRIDEKLKKIAKRKKSRDKRAARKPAATVAAPSAPSMETRDGGRSRARAAARRPHAWSSHSGGERIGTSWPNQEADVHERFAAPTGGDKAMATKKQYFRRKKVCRFCVEKIDDINYKDVRMLMSFISERGKIVPRRISGVCTPHQRRLAEAIKQARNIVLDSVRRADLKGTNIMKSFSEKTSKKLGTRGQLVKVTPGYARIFCCPNGWPWQPRNPIRKLWSRSIRVICARKPNWFPMPASWPR